LAGDLNENFSIILKLFELGPQHNNIVSNLLKVLNMPNFTGQEIARITSSETLWDAWSRKIYSVDASNFQIEPIVINYPQNEFDVQHICEYASTRNIPLVCRGGGTGLLGQCLSNGIVLDFVRNMNKILEIGENYVVVEPGITKYVLDLELRKHGKFIPPNPASSNYCTIGGMIANNSSGPYTLGYGSMISYVSGVDTVYSGGVFGYAYDNGKFDTTVKKMTDILVPKLGLIKRIYPKVNKNSCGYRLDSIFDEERFHPQRIFLASEGTLGIVTKAKLLTLNIPEFRHLCLLSFPDVEEAARSIPLILKHKPVAVELLDGYSNVKVKPDDNLRKNCTLLVEFHGEIITQLEKGAKNFEIEVSQFAQVLESTTDPASIEKIWHQRKNALNSVLKMTVGSRSSLGIIEDTIVDPSLLAQFVVFLTNLYKKYKVDYVIYGHAGDGNLHTRPIIETGQDFHESLIEEMASNVFKYIISHGGSISAEHGDGLARVKYIPKMYGVDIYRIFVRIKEIFDEKNIMNPGKKVLFEDE
jgi:glycolate oxidase